MENQPSPVETFPILPGRRPARVTRSDDLRIRLQSYFAAETQVTGPSLPYWA